MRFLHIADLHIGKRLKVVSLLEDQAIILREIAELAKAHAVDAVLIAGDIYQKSSPQGDAMALFNRFVTRLCEDGIKVFIISGNHDSDQRISYFSALLRASGVYVSEQFTGRLQSIELRDEHGPLMVHLLPFVRPSMVRHCFPGESIQNDQEAIECILKHSPIDFGRRNVLVAHQFITGAVTSESEELFIGGLEQVDARVFDGFDYVALGHVHTPQTAGRETCRYAGSIMKYSLSEAEHTKQALLVDVGEKGNIEIMPLPLKMPHEMRTIRGTVEEILRMPYSEDYVYVTVTDELVAPDARVTISTVFPNMLDFGVQNSRTREDRGVQAQDRDPAKDWLELFRDFFRLQNNDADVPETHIEMLREIAAEIMEGAYETD